MNQPALSATEVTEIRIREGLTALWHGRLIIVGVTLLALSGAYFYSSRQTPSYESQTKVLVETISLGDGTQVVPNMDTETQIAESPAVARIANDSLDLGGPVQGLLSHISVDAPLNTQILVFDASAPSPRQAQRIAKAFGDAYLSFTEQRLAASLSAPVQVLQDRIRTLHNRYVQVKDALANTSSSSERGALQARIDSLQSQIAVLQERASTLNPSPSLSAGEVVEPAAYPSGPSSPSYPLNLAVAGILGLAIGVGLVFLRERLNERVRGRVDLERFVGVPVLAVLPPISRKYRMDPTALWVDSSGSTTLEAYRTLRAGLLFAASSRGAKAILITSSKDGEGKSTVAANVAAALSESGKRVALVSGDLRRPQLEEFFACISTTGLTDVLAGEAKLYQALVDLTLPSLQLLPTGRLPGNKTQLLGSPAMEGVLTKLRQLADFIVIDSAPVLGTSDALALAPLVDAVLFVNDPDRADRRAVARARRQLDLINAVLIGSVLNRFNEARALESPYVSPYVAPELSPGEQPTQESLLRPPSPPAEKPRAPRKTVRRSTRSGSARASGGDAEPNGSEGRRAQPAPTPVSVESEDRTE
jgi:capsular exopolysaccharide synthesis family protein